MKMNTSVKAAAPEKTSENRMYFPQGLLGLEGCHNFLVEPVPDNEYFVIFESVEDPDIGLILTDPFPFFPEYEFDLAEADQRELEIKKKEEVLVLVVVTIRGKKMFANLAAPVMVNPVLRKAKQVILPDRLDKIRVALDT
ncbi:MAG: flagellar assembly protein FliW [Firmicutes bacterium]|nr:flagellar assembly protein FliW [Bacillota bacterium]